MLERKITQKAAELLPRGTATPENTEKHTEARRRRSEQIESCAVFLFHHKCAAIYKCYNLRPNGGRRGGVPAPCGRSANDGNVSVRRSTHCKGRESALGLEVVFPLSFFFLFFFGFQRPNLADSVGAELQRQSSNANTATRRWRRCGSMTCHLGVEPSPPLLGGWRGREWRDENHGGGESNEEKDQYVALINNLLGCRNLPARFMISPFLDPFAPSPPSPPAPQCICLLLLSSTRKKKKILHLCPRH